MAHNFISKELKSRKLYLFHINNNNVGVILHMENFSKILLCFCVFIDKYYTKNTILLRVSKTLITMEFLPVSYNIKLIYSNRI